MDQAVLRGKCLILMLWDVSKFFVSIRVPELIMYLEKLGFSIGQLCQGMCAQSSKVAACTEPLWLSHHGHLQQYLGWLPVVYVAS